LTPEAVKILDRALKSKVIPDLAIKRLLRPDQSPDIDNLVGEATNSRDIPEVLAIFKGVRPNITVLITST